MEGRIAARRLIVLVAHVSPFTCDEEVRMRALAVLFAGLVAGSLATRNGAIVDVQNQSERQALRQLFAQRVEEYVALQ